MHCSLQKYNGLIILSECASSFSSCSWTCSCCGVLNASINACCFSSISNRVRFSSSSSCFASSSFAAVSAARRSSSAWASAASRSCNHTQHTSTNTVSQRTPARLLSSYYRLSVTLYTVVKQYTDPITKVSEQVNRNCRQRTQILQLSTPYTDPIPSNSPPLEPYKLVPSGE